MGHYDECREGYCCRCGQTIGNCEHTGKDSKAYKAYQEIVDKAIQAEIGNDFAYALKELMFGRKLARLGWNGAGVYIKIQWPDEDSFMTQPYIYIDTTGLKTNNPKAPKGRVPWLASQTDLLSSDWVVVSHES